MTPFFYVKSSKEDLIWDHYLSSPPIEAFVILLTWKLPRCSNRESNPRCPAHRQGPPYQLQLSANSSAEVNTVYLQTVHLYGFSPLCQRKCTFSLSALLKALLHL